MNIHLNLKIRLKKCNIKIKVRLFIYNRCTIYDSLCL